MSIRDERRDADSVPGSSRLSLAHTVGCTEQRLGCLARDDMVEGSRRLMAHDVWLVTGAANVYD